MSKILNLYAGIGGNRALWDDEHEITAIENVPHIADTYRKLWPNDTVVEVDAHQYLLDHYKEFDFIWSSPPCPSHSMLQIIQNSRGNVRYPDMTLYQEVIFLQQFCHVPWIVENVKPYYKVLISPSRECARHLFWSNFHISKYFDDSDFTNVLRQYEITTKTPEDAGIKSIVDRWYEMHQETETKKQFEQELREYITIEKIKLLEYIEGELPQKQILQNKEVYPRAYWSAKGVNAAIDDFCTLLAKKKEGLK